MRGFVIVGLAVILSGCGHMGLAKPMEIGEKINPPPLTIPEGWAGTSQDLAYRLISLSDTRCENYLVGVAYQANASTGYLDVTALGLGSVASLVTQSNAANAFAAGGTFLQGTQRTLNDTVFAGREFPLIYDAVKYGRRLEREKLFADIADPARNWNSLSSEGVLARIQPYDHNCGITYGRVQLAKAVGAGA